MAKLIVAVDPNGVIGINNTIPWHYKPDMKRFAQVTKGGWLIMGRNTWESMGRRHLPGRVSLVLSQTPQVNVETHPSVASAIARAEKAGAPIWVIGGARVYQEALEQLFVNDVDLTVVPAVNVPEGQSPVTFSMGWLAGFTLVSSEINPDEPKLEHRHYTRK